MTNQSAGIDPKSLMMYSLFLDIADDRLMGVGACGIIQVALSVDVECM